MNKTHEMIGPLTNVLVSFLHHEGKIPARVLSSSDLGINYRGNWLSVSLFTHQ